MKLVETIHAPWVHLDADLAASGEETAMKFPLSIMISDFCGKHSLYTTVSDHLTPLTEHGIILLQRCGRSRVGLFEQEHKGGSSANSRKRLRTMGLDKHRPKA